MFLNVRLVMILVAMLSYLGLHVIAREVIFVDLSLAQMAAAGQSVGAALSRGAGLADDVRVRVAGGPPWARFCSR